MGFQCYAIRTKGVSIVAVKSKIEKVPGWKSEATKDKIRKAALEIFAKKGFAAASTRMIAKKAGTNVALISRYFGGKEQLFKFIIQDETKKILESDLSYPAQDSLRDEIREYINSMLNFLETNVAFFRIVITQSLVDRKLSIFLKEAIIPEEDERLFVRLSRLEKMELLGDGVTPRELNLSVMAFIIGQMLYSLMLVGKSKVNLKDSVEGFLNVVCRDNVGRPF